MYQCDDYERVSVFVCPCFLLQDTLIVPDKRSILKSKYSVFLLMWQSFKDKYLYVISLFPNIIFLTQVLSCYK